MMTKTTFATIFSFILFTSILTGQSTKENPNQNHVEKYAVLKILLDGQEQLNEMAVHDIDFDHIHGDIETGIEMKLTHKDIEKLDELDIKYEVVIADYNESKEKQKPVKTAVNYGGVSIGGFFTLTEIETKLDEMYKLIPSIFTKNVMGTSIKDKSVDQTIHVASLSIRPNPANNYIQLDLQDKLDSKMTKVTILTNFGEIVKTYDLNQTSNTKLPISDLPGDQSYLIMATAENGSSFIEKFDKV